jgi:hypothetical protein
VLWLHFAECTDCTEAAIRTTAPVFDDLIFDNISLRDESLEDGIDRNRRVEGGGDQPSTRADGSDVVAS